MLSTRDKISELLRLTNTNLWGLAAAIQVEHDELSEIVFGGNAPASVLKGLNDFCLMLGVCPECLSLLRSEGGCKICLCGWSVCP